MRWIIGDVHGMLKSLEALLSEISRVDSGATLYFVGDYVNRGPEARGVVELLLTLKNAKFIRGNHDDMLDLVLHGTSYAENASRGDRFIAFQWFLEHGLYETLLSYGATQDQIFRVVSQRTRDSLDSIIDLFPESHRQFLRTLPVYLEDRDLFVVHGKWPLRETSTPAAALAGEVPVPPLRHEILWGRYTDAELTGRVEPAWPKKGYFGHTPVQTYRGHETDSTPIIFEKLILLDTAAALIPTGRLTAICAESGRVLQTDPNGELAAGAALTDVPAK
ncbi:MAG TPA: metallophosphoesterase [Tepidisphaeraceae bacterium]|jgi:hypothetical protein